MSTSEMTPGEMYKSLNGFDAIAIATHFGRKLGQLRADAETDGETFVQALAFVDQRRQGLSDKDAWQAAMGLSMGELEDYFAMPEDELDPENPETEQGKAQAL